MFFQIEIRCLVTICMCYLFGFSLSNAADNHIISPDSSICGNFSLTSDPSAEMCTWNGSSLICYGSMSNFDDLIKFSLDKIETTKEFVLCGWKNSTFNATEILQHFANLKKLKIEHSNMTNFTDFPALPYLESINISWTKLSNIKITSFQDIRLLKTLDLRWNQLDHLEGPLLMAPRFGKLFLAGNPWNCTKNLRWILNETRTKYINDRESLMCSDSIFNGKPVMTVMFFKKKLKEECSKNSDLKNCSCTLSYLRRTEDGNSFHPLYSINCSNLNLNSLPSVLPENTTIFFATNNKIDNIEPLRNTYQTLQDIYLDFNSIQSIDILDTEYWLQNFRTFSLKGNKLTKIPVYALDNALEKNHNVVQLFLSQNPWRCDCLFTMRFQELLRKYNTIIKDSANVTCKYIEGDDNFGTQVLSLSRSNVCKLATEYKIQPLDLLNGVLGSLIVLVLGKLGYDYYHYRKSGRLPWIVTKMP